MRLLKLTALAACSPFGESFSFMAFPSGTALAVAMKLLLKLSPKGRSYKDKKGSHSLSEAIKIKAAHGGAIEL